MLTRPDKRSQISIESYSKILRIIKNTEGKSNYEVGSEFASIWNNSVAVTKASIAEILNYYSHIDRLLNSDKDVEVRQMIRVNGKLYGLDPDIAGMEWGAFTDISALASRIEEGDNLAKLMAIIYRPVKKSYFRKLYSVTKYTDEPQDAFDSRFILFNKELTLEEVQGVLAFFLCNQKMS